jgi:hypothetical protein
LLSWPLAPRRKRCCSYLQQAAYTPIIKVSSVCFGNKQMIYLKNLHKLFWCRQ